MKLASKFALAFAVAAVASTGVASASDNWSSTDGKIWRNSTNLCWQDNFWTPATAAAECGGELVAERIPLQADAFFNFDKATLKPEGRAKLDELVQKLNTLKLESLVAVGYTDIIGSAKYNLKLSKRRAEAVKAYLVSKGIPAEQIVTSGKGKTEQWGKGKSAEARAKNRRVVVDIVGSKKA